jgi:hypothetical protein
MLALNLCKCNIYGGIFQKNVIHGFAMELNMGLKKRSTAKVWLTSF